MKLNKKRIMKDEDLDDLSFEDNKIDTEDNLNMDDDLDMDSYSDDFDVGGDVGIPAMEKHKDLLKELTNFDAYIKDTVNNWLGLIWDQQKEAYVPNPLMKPLMNIQGAMWCVGVLKTYVRNNNIITNMSHDDYKNMMIDIIHNIWLNLGTRRELGIQNHGDLLRVCNELEHSAELILMGAGAGKYSDLLTKTVNRSETVNLNGQQNGGFNEMPQTYNKNGWINKLKEGVLKL